MSDFLKNENYILSISSVDKYYGDFQAVKELNLEVKNGELFSFLGLNGAGKTTTIKMITGLTPPSSGKIEIGGSDIVNEPNEAKFITGYVPDRAFLFEKLSCYELVKFSSELYNTSEQNIEESIIQVLNDFQLLDKREELVQNLSHGMRQRLAICAALIHKPKLLVIDEPMVGLDPHGAKSLKNYLRNFVKNGGSIFLSTHSLGVAQELSDRIGIIHHGKLIACGTVEELSGLTKEKENLEEIFLELTKSV